MHINHCQNAVRHSQTSIFIAAYKSKALNFILIFPNEVMNRRIDLLNYIFSLGNISFGKLLLNSRRKVYVCMYERCMKHKLGCDKCLHDLDFSVSPLPFFQSFQ